MSGGAATADTQRWLDRAAIGLDLINRFTGSSAMPGFVGLINPPSPCQARGRASTGAGSRALKPGDLNLMELAVAVAVPAPSHQRAGAVCAPTPG